MYRTNLFRYNDYNRIYTSCKEHDVLCTRNGIRVALLSDNLNKLRAVLMDCFDNRAKIKVDDGVVLVGF